MTKQIWSTPSIETVGSIEQLTGVDKTPGFADGITVSGNPVGIPPTTPIS